MSNYAEINIKENMPTVNEAMDVLRKYVEGCKRGKCVVIVHGYGSSGKGGAIRTKARQWLEAQQKVGKIKTVIKGEEISVFNFAALDLKKKHRELDAYFKVCNHGITVIEI